MLVLWKSHTVNKAFEEAWRQTPEGGTSLWNEQPSSPLLWHLVWIRLKTQHPYLFTWAKTKLLETLNWKRFQTGGPTLYLADINSIMAKYWLHVLHYIVYITLNFLPRWIRTSSKFEVSHEWKRRHNIQCSFQETSSMPTGTMALGALLPWVWAIHSKRCLGKGHQFSFQRY